MKLKLLSGFLLFLFANLNFSEVRAAEKLRLLADTGQVTHRSENLIVRKLSDHVYEHTTFLHTNTFGRVSCNGMIVVNNNEAVIFDTPSSNKDSEELLNYLVTDLKWKVKAIVATHFHADCLGGLDEFHKRGIPSYASNRTIQFAHDIKAALPQNGFDSELFLEVAGKKVYTAFFGEGHTRDNVIAYFPDDKIMFGGCLIKEMNATKGNLADANTEAWPATVRSIKAKYPLTKIVIPGHGKLGGTELLDYTIELFSK